MRRCGTLWAHMTSKWKSVVHLPGLMTLVFSQLNRLWRATIFTFIEVLGKLSQQKSPAGTFYCPTLFSLLWSVINVIRIYLQSVSIQDSNSRPEATNSWEESPEHCAILQWMFSKTATNYFTAENRSVGDLHTNAFIFVQTLLETFFGYPDFRRGKGSRWSR
jgi:hypothetical protein